jgi:hypothetical protein
MRYQAITEPLETEAIVYAGEIVYNVFSKLDVRATKTPSSFDSLH